jgi:ABC-type glycerol-3-phosphate transport system permease component
MGDGHEPGAIPAGELTGATMNRAFFIILIPPLLVLVGYAVVFRFMGVSPEYWRVLVPVVLLAGAFWWLSRKTASKRSAAAK